MAQELSDLFESKNFVKDEVIVSQGSKTDGMYKIKAGQVEVVQDGVVIATLGEGDFFGEMGLVFNDPRSATIRVSSDALSADFLSKKTYRKAEKEWGDEVTQKALERYKEINKKYL